MTKADLRERLEAVRTRTLWLLERVPDEDLKRRVHLFYSPIGWHFGHVGRTEEFWVCGEAMGRPLVDVGLTFLFADRPDNPKENRVNLPDRAGLIEYLQETRRRTLAALEEAEIGPDAPEILRDGYAFLFAAQHEAQHQETIAELLGLLAREHISMSAQLVPWRPSEPPTMVTLSGGRFRMGDHTPETYDNESPAFECEIKPFRLADAPVTTYEWTQFIEAGGYQDRGFWTDDGWRWLEEESATMPDGWVRRPAYWGVIGPFGERALQSDEPVTGISFHEAEAYAKWIGLRLPTEFEWEYAASRCGGTFPWGDDLPTSSHAVHGLKNWGAAPVRSCPAGATSDGVYDLAGNVWEWTSSAFLPYDGFRAYPYDGYSLDYMKGAHRVCRGGSWATSPGLLRRTFRNFYVPTYRQGFLGLRLAADVD